MNPLFHNILISAPNGGGLFLLRHGIAHRLDSLSTTGLGVGRSTLYRGVQPETLKVYGAHPSELSGLDGEMADIHDVAIIGEDLFVVGTDRNVVVRLSDTGSLLERWTLPGERDSCHLNCIAHWRDRIVYSCFGDYTTHRGYKGQTRERGMIRDLHSGEVLISGLSQPHSPASCGDHLLVANSELHEIREYDPMGRLVRVKTLDSYTRGIAVRGDVILVGLSCPREKKEDQSFRFSSQVVMLDRNSWEIVGKETLPTSEIYAVVPFDAEDHSDTLVQLITENESARQRAEDQAKDLEATIGKLETMLEKEQIERKLEIDKLNRQIRDVSEDLREVLTSLSWRVTAPLRSGMSKIRAVLGGLSG